MSQLTALLTTLIIELVVAILARPKLWRGPRGPFLRWLGLVAAASLMTHPFAWWLNMHIDQPFWLRAALIEAGVVVVEASLFWRMETLSWRRALLTSLATNGMSFGLGLVLYEVGVL